MADRTVIQVTHGQTQARVIGQVFALEAGRLRQAPQRPPAPDLVAVRS
jgi:ABC-type transport system involved in cytochrome bd biosynthesis fused ATPase/permease subunit